MGRIEARQLRCLLVGIASKSATRRFERQVLLKLSAINVG